METMKSNFQPQISVPDWVKLPSETRQKLIKQFSIPKTGGSEMQLIGGQRQLVSDGHTHLDLKVMSVEKLQQFTESTSTDFYELLNKTIEKLSVHVGPTTEQILEQKKSDKLTHFSYVLSTLKREANELGYESELQNLITLAFGEKKVNRRVK